MISRFDLRYRPRNPSALPTEQWCFRVKQFCSYACISSTEYSDIRRQGWQPKELQFGVSRTNISTLRISREAINDWEITLSPDYELPPVKLIPVDATTAAPVYLSSNRIKQRLTPAEVISLASSVNKDDLKPKDAVYVVSGGGHMKIGVSNNVMFRITQLQSYCAVPLTLEMVLSGNRHLETHLHYKFHEHRRWGEWFVHSKELLKDIKAAAEIWISDPKYAQLW